MSFDLNFVGQEEDEFGEAVHFFDCLCIQLGRICFKICTCFERDNNPLFFNIDICVISQLTFLQLLGNLLDDGVFTLIQMMEYQPVEV